MAHLNMFFMLKVLKLTFSEYSAHHLYLIVDDWADNPFSYCKPVAKNPSKRAHAIISKELY